MHSHAKEYKYCMYTQKNIIIACTRKKNERVAKFTYLPLHHTELCE